MTGMTGWASPEYPQIVHEKKILYLLNDVNAFKEDKVYSRIFKKMYEEGLLNLMYEDDLDRRLMILKSNEYAVEFTKSNSDIYEFIRKVKDIIDSHRILYDNSNDTCETEADKDRAVPYIGSLTMKNKLK